MKQLDEREAERIVLVEDEKEIAELLAFYLKNEGYQVTMFHHGKEALTHLLNTEYDMAILDVMLPEVGGFELCKAIRKQYFYPIMMLTARGEDMDKIMGLTIGADDYMTKPFNPLEVVTRVKSQLRRYKKYNQEKRVWEKREREYDVHGLYINQDTHECTLMEEIVSLTPIEFSILWYLCERRGKVVSSEELFEGVWSVGCCQNHKK